MKALGLGALALGVALLAAGPAPPAATAPTPPAPEAIQPEAAPLSTWRSLTTGRFHACGIKTSGRLFCWGNDGQGQLGNGGANVGRVKPTQVAGGFTDWTSVTAGRAHTCGIRAGGRLFCWGSDDGFLLGNGPAIVDKSVPAPVAGGFTDWTSVSAGWGHNCARRATGQLYCWGSDAWGMLGDGAPISSHRAVPTLVAGGFSDWKAVSAGNQHTCGRRAGRLYCWGLDHDGQLGTGTPGPNELAPTLVAGGITDWVAVSAGGAHTCGRRSGGQLLCWGDDGSGQLGDGAPRQDRPTPAAVLNTPWTTFDAGRHHTCARRRNGRLFCWGNDAWGALGNGGGDVNRVRPFPVAGNARYWVEVSAGTGFTCARRTGGVALCWGHDNSGQLGDGPPNADRDIPWFVT